MSSEETEAWRGEEGADLFTDSRSQEKVPSGIFPRGKETHVWRQGLQTGLAECVTCTTAFNPEVDIHIILILQRRQHQRG